MKTLPKCDHLAKIGLERLEACWPEWQAICMHQGRQWFLLVRNSNERDDWIRLPPEPHRPGYVKQEWGIPYGFATPDEALTFKARCIKKLQRFLKKNKTHERTTTDSQLHPSSAHAEAAGCH